MAVRVGHASKSETSSINGVKGDQTGTEVKINNWYSDRWNHMFIHPDPAVRERHAAAVEAGCNNNKVGYGQSDRNTLYAEAKKAGMDLSKITKPCNADCSSFQNVCAVASGAPGATYGSNGWTVSTMIKALPGLGYKDIRNTAYLRSADYCVRGAIITKNGHTVCALDNGSKYQETLKAAGLSTSGAATGGSSSSSNTGNAGTSGSKVPYLVSVKVTSLRIRKGPGTNYGYRQFCPVGVYTIVEEADGPGATKWGKLKSGAGWISLDYATKM